jgi:hypothetical protein
MARGPLKKETVQARALAKAAEVLGVAVEELNVPVVIETPESKIFEAQSAALYFEVRGNGFRHQTCEVCKERFAYAWDVAGVKCCSVVCMAKKLENMGLKWDPTRPPERRWGQTVPAIVPSFALKNIQQVLAGTPKDQPQNMLHE